MTWTYIILMCFFSVESDMIVCCYIVAFCIVNLVFSFVNKSKVYLFWKFVHCLDFAE